MNTLVDSFRMALAALSANRLRAVLTTMGVVIGIFFVLLMGWVLDGLDRAFTDSFAFFGDDILYIDKFNWSGEGNWRDQWNRRDIDLNQYAAFKRRMTGAEYVVPTSSTMSMNVEHGDLIQNGTMIFGTNPEYIEMFSGALASGRFFNETEYESASNVVIVGHNISENLYPEGDPVGKSIRLEGRTFMVIGVLPKRGTMLVDFMDNVAYLPLTRYFSLYGSRAGITINVKAGGVERVPGVRDRAEGVMRSIRRLDATDENDFAINSQEMFSEIVGTMRTVVWSVGIFMTGLAFLVGSIGIMNIMFVSVTERVREIGIRKAVGARRSTILLQFLVESVFLCSIGAFIGLVLTSLIALFKDQLINGILDGLVAVHLIIERPEVDLSFLGSTIPPGQVALAIVVAIAVGLLAGIIPAYRASRLSPVDALRAE